VTGLEYSVATEKSNVSARGSAVPRFKFGQEDEHSGERSVCCDPPMFVYSSWETPRAFQLDEKRVDQSPVANRYVCPNSNIVQTCEYTLHYAIRLLQSAQSGNSFNKANSLEILHLIRKQLIPFSKYSYNRNPK
jgi:hypothetical protein